MKLCLFVQLFIPFNQSHRERLCLFRLFRQKKKLASLLHSAASFSDSETKMKTNEFQGLFLQIDAISIGTT